MRDRTSDRGREPRGADGLIAGDVCAKAAPDGYTLCASNSGMIIFNMVVRRDAPYDSLRDLVPVIQVGFFDSVLAVIPSLPVNSLPQLFDFRLYKSEPLQSQLGTQRQERHRLHV